MNSGQSSPSSNDRIVPVTTPMANRAIITFDQRRASASTSASPRRRPSHSIPSTSVGNATPKQTSGMCTANDSACICRASSRYVLVDRTEHLCDLDEHLLPLLGCDRASTPGYAMTLVGEPEPPAPHDQVLQHADGQAGRETSSIMALA